MPSSTITQLPILPDNSVESINLLVRILEQALLTTQDELSTLQTNTGVATVGNVPSNVPVPTSIDTDVSNIDGSLIVTFLISQYIQGSTPADKLLLFISEGDSPLAAPTVTSATAAVPYDINRTAFRIDGLNPDNNYRFAIAASRLDAEGIERIGAIQAPASGPDWADITGGTPQFRGNIGESPDAAPNQAINPSFEDDITYGWDTSDSGTITATWSTDATTFLYGAKAAKVEVSGISGGGFTTIRSYNEILATVGKAIPATIGEEWMIAGWATCTVETGSTLVATLKLQEYDSSGGFLRATTSAWPTGQTFDWTQRTITATLGASTEFINITITVEGDSSTGTLFFDGMQAILSTTLPAFDDDFQAVATAAQVAHGTLLNVALDTLAANINAIPEDTWTDIMSVTIAISHNNTDYAVIIQGKFGAEVSGSDGDVDFFWRILRNGTVIWSSHATRSTQDNIVDVSSMFHADTSPTDMSVVHEYRLQVYWDMITATTATVDVETPGAFFVQAFSLPS